MALDKAVTLSIQGTTGEKKYFEKLNALEQNKAKNKQKTQNLTRYGIYQTFKDLVCVRVAVRRVNLRLKRLKRN